MTNQTLVIKDTLIIKDQINKPENIDEDDESVIPENVDQVDGLEYIENG